MWMQNAMDVFCHTPIHHHQQNYTWTPPKRSVDKETMTDARKRATLHDLGMKNRIPHGQEERPPFFITAPPICTIKIVSNMQHPQTWSDQSAKGKPQNRELKLSIST